LGCFRNVSEDYVSSISRQFPDFPTSTDNLIFEWLWRSGGASGDLLLLDAWTSYQQLTESLSQQADLLRLGQGLKNRQTSKPDDETLCIGTLLGIDIKPLFAKSGPDRMKYLFQTVDRIRPAIIFSETPRLEDEGWGWAPLSFLRPERHPREPGHHGRLMWAERREEGLIVDFDGFLLPDNVVVDEFQVTIDATVYTVHLRLPEQDLEIKKMALIHELRLADLEDENFSAKAIMVQVSQFRGNVQYAKFVCMGRISRAMNGLSGHVNVMKTASTRWCIG
jgi:hypothetical protein